MQHNHYIPQQYLLRFADSEGRVWLHDKEKKSDSSHPGVRVIGNELGLYSDEVETNLNLLAEVPSHAAFDKVIAGVPLSEADRAAFAKYVIVMRKRVPAAKVRSLGRIPGIADEVRSDLMTEIDELVVADPTFESKAAGVRNQVTEYIQKVKSAPPAHLWYESFGLDDIMLSEQALLSMNWVFLRSDSHQFLTSDNPVFFFSNEGLGRPQSELTFPVSSSIALWATRLPYTQGSYSDAAPSIVRQVNARTAAYSKRFVFSKTNEPWIKPFTVKGRWSLEHLK